MIAYILFMMFITGALLLLLAMADFISSIFLYIAPIMLYMSFAIAMYFGIVVGGIK